MKDEQKKDEIKTKLLDLNYFKTPDGKQLYELSLDELEAIYKSLTQK
ncbi:Fur-regulated basic protein FbpA [Priestia megaterium]